MFDKLVESTKAQKKGRSKFFVTTSLIYGFSLSALGVLSILWFNPAPVEAYNVVGLLAPPPVPAAPPPATLKPVVASKAESISFIPPVKPPEKIPVAVDVPPRSANRNTPVVIGTPNIGRDVGNSYLPSGLEGGTGEAPPPPPPPAPTPKATPTPVPTPEPQKIIPMTSVMIAGKAIKRVQPPYPQIAKAVRAQGAVSVQVLISENGHVLEATVVGGHPTLREAARQAAQDWVFSPTILNGKGVKVSGILTFNFTLN